MKRLIQVLFAICALQCLPLQAQAVEVETEARQLLTHTSSIIDLGELYSSETVYFPGADNPISLGDFVREYLSSAGKFFDAANFALYPPGDERQYSNIAYGLAGYLVEVLSGQPLNRFSADEIFEPLNMRSARRPHLCSQY